MANTNLSTLLLLGVLLFLIYCLMQQPKQNFTNESNENENFENENEIENFENESIEDRNEEPFADESEDEKNLVDQNLNAKQLRSSEPRMEAPAKRNFQMEAPTVPEISQELVNQLVSETEKAPVNSTLLGNAESVYNFEPNDDSTQKGASLDNAFERPVPDDSKTDVVDLHRNNLTNYNAKDYLPKEINDDWFNTDFSQAKYKMNDDKLINTDKYIIGINTVGQSLKNASYDIRGAVNVPKYTVSPWNNSTIEPDYNIKPLC